MNGLFITFEGPEGAGKSTQVRRLAESLAHDGYRVYCTREPGGTSIGEQIRSLLLNRSGAAMVPETEALLHTAARAQHVREVICPALDRGEIVLCDRFVESTLAYQGGGRGLPIEELRRVQQIAVGSTMPDMRILLDLPVEVGLKRRHEAADLNRMDELDVAFHERVRATYHELVNADRDGWTVVDATRSLTEVNEDIRAVVATLIARTGARHREIAAV